MIQRRAFITGITGQDGSYLAELLLSKDYEVHGMIRRSSSFNTGRIDHIFDKLHLYHGDMADSTALRAMLRKAAPDEVYHLAAQSHVAVSFELPEYTGEIDALGVLRILEAVREVCPAARVYNASTSEMFGNAPSPQGIYTPMQPVSPYGAAKLYAYNLVRMYRDAYNLWVVNGIMFNHESPRRGETFVTRKITRALARIKANRQELLVLGNLDARRDWGFAGDYVDAMWRMLQAKDPQDYVVATGVAHSVWEFVMHAASIAGVDLTGKLIIDDKYKRPNEIGLLRGDATPIMQQLDWVPSVGFEQLVELMVEADMGAP